MRRRFIFIFIIVVSSVCVLAQTTIRTGTEVKVKGLVSTQGSLSNSSDKLDLTDAQIILTGTNQTLTTTSPRSLQGLIVEGGGTKTTQGDWTITKDLIFTLGTLTPATGKLLYTGSTILSGNTSSFVNGVLYQRGTGVRFFPLGVRTTYMPMSLNNIKDGNLEIGVTGFTSGTNLTLPADITSVASDRYWQVAVSGGTLNETTASLYVPGSSIDASSKLAVVEADNINGATAINLGGGVTDNFATSFSPVTKPILTLGIVEKVDLRIMDLITPFNGDPINAQLKIVNIESTFENKVTLLDRYGIPVHEWKNFRNYDDPLNPSTDTFDFTKLSPGNYICVLEYTLSADAPKQNLNQMISVLRGN